MYVATDCTALFSSPPTYIYCHIPIIIIDPAHTPLVSRSCSSISPFYLHESLQQPWLWSCFRFRLLHNPTAAAKSNRLLYSTLPPITMSAYDPDPYNEGRRHRAAGPPTGRDPRDAGMKPRPRRDRYDADDSDDDEGHPRRSHHRAPAVKSPDAAPPPPGSSRKSSVPPPPIGRNRGGPPPDDDNSPPSRHSRRDRDPYADEDPHRSSRHRGSSHRRPRDPYADDDGDDGHAPPSRRHRERGTADAYYADEPAPSRRHRHDPPSRDKSRGGSGGGGGSGGDPRDRRHRSRKPSRYDDGPEDDSDHAPPPARPRRSHREQRERDRDDDRGYRSEHHSKRHDRDETDGRGYRTDGRETRREREKRKERERERDREREKPSRSSRRHDDDYDDRDRDRDRHDDRRRPSRRDRESSGGMLPKVKPKEMLEKGKKGWETAKPVAGPLLGTLAKAYLEKGH